MQIIYISNRPEMLLETLEHVAVFMPFIDQAIACVPKKQIEQLHSVSTALPLKLVSENAILSNDQMSILDKLDHQRRNYLLRTHLVQHPSVQTQFIMSDDDARPLRTINPDLFIKDGQYRAYYFYYLSKWNSQRTEFDTGQIATFSVLNALGYPTKSFASHMPQVIDKAIFLEAIDTFCAYSKKQPLCEWSTYFNFAISEYSDKFLQASKYVSLCWPEHPLAWEQQVVPEQFMFENFTPELYASGQVFEGLPMALQSTENVEGLTIEKVNRWRRHMILSRHPEQAPGLRKYMNWRTWVNKLLNHIESGRRET